MKIEELVRLVNRDPPTLILNFSLRCDNGIGFSEFLWILSASKSIRHVDYHGIFDRSLHQIQKDQLIEAFGLIKNLEELCFSNGVSIPSKALGIAVRQARSLRMLKIESTLSSNGEDDATINGEYMDSGMKIFANALKNHPTLETFVWIIRQKFDFAVANALASCARLRKVSLIELGNFSVSSGLAYIAASKSIKSLETQTAGPWGPVANLLKAGDSNCSRGICLTSLSVYHFPCRSDQPLTLEDVQDLAVGIQNSLCLETLCVGIRSPFTEEMAIVLADAIRLNRGNLKTVTLHITEAKRSDRIVAAGNDPLRRKIYKIFCDSINENYNLALNINIGRSGSNESTDEWTLRSQIQILSKVNSLGRGLLWSKNATASDWVRILNQIDNCISSDQEGEDDATHMELMSLSGIYYLLRSNPLFIVAEH